MPFWLSLTAAALHAGKEMVSDARLVKDENIMDGTMLMAAASPQANPYTLLTPEKAAGMEETSPASLLARSVSSHTIALEEIRPGETWAGCPGSPTKSSSGHKSPVSIPG